MIIAVTVIGKDRPGIISALTGAIYKAGGNLEDASMTILEGEFAMIFLAALKNIKMYEKLLNQLEKLEREVGLLITAKEIKHSLERGQKYGSGTSSWIVSVSGKDRAGIVHKVSKLLADEKLNITDLDSKILGKGKQTAYALILEVDVPHRDIHLIPKLKNKFSKLGKEIGVTIAFNPVESSHF